MKQGGYRWGGKILDRPASSRAGFTIVETLIVLAVTSALFISAAALISGRQSRTQFTVAVNDARQQIQQVINETVSGYYPNNSDFSCTNPAGIPRIDAGTNGQGTNGDCVFIGKVLYFGPANPSLENYSVISMAANRLTLAKKDVSTLAEAVPTAIAPGNATNPTAPDATVINELQNGLSYVWGGSSSPTPGNFAIAFFRNLDSTAANGKSGTNQFGLYRFAIPGWPATSNRDVIDAIDGNSTSMIRETVGQSFCLKSGSTNQSGLFTISAGLQVQLQIKATKDCS